MILATESMAATQILRWAAFALGQDDW